MVGTPEGLDRTLALIAPGQGSQRIGMGFELAQRSPAAAEVWRESDEALFPSMDFNFSKLAWYGKRKGVQLDAKTAQEELTKTENAQPAIIIASIARIAALKERGLYGNPHWKTGNSLGFIVACYASGVIDIQETVKLGKARGDAMEFARTHTGESAMMAVQHDEPEVIIQVIEDLKTRFPLRESLFNTHNQVIVSGDVRSIEEAKAYVTKQDPKLGEQLKILPVSAAFHNPDFMGPGLPIYAEAVDELDIKIPNGGLLIASVLPITPLDTEASIREALKAQFVEPDHWRDAVEFLGRQGVIRMIELNVAPTLSDFNRRLLGGEREKIVLPDAVDSKGNSITIGWRWFRAAPAEDSEVIELAERYASVTDMEGFLELPAPGTYEGILLWYRKWTATRTGKDISEIRPDGDFVEDSEMDSLDYSVLRADVYGAFGRIVSEEEAQGNVTPELAARATYGLMVK